jgi:hypothetical protein
MLMLISAAHPNLLHVIEVEVDYLPGCDPSVVDELGRREFLVVPSSDT